MNNFIKYRLAVVTAIVCLAAVQATALAKARFVPADVVALWITPNQPAQVIWRTEDLPADDTAVEYTISDYAGARVAQGSTSAINGQITVNLNLPAGYYTLEFPVTQQRFGLMSIEPFAGRPDPFFSINSILDWLVAKNQSSPSRADYIKIMRRSGVSMAREGLGWSDILQPAGDSWNWDADQDYDKLFQAYASNGIPLLTLLNTAPNHLGKAIGQGGNRFPLDMLAVEFSWRRLSDHWQSAWGAAEIWNEPDGTFGGSAPPDQYAPVAKSMAHAFSRQKSRVQLVGGVVAAGWDESFYQLAVGNGLLKNIDAWSFHTYGHHTPKTMQTLIRNYRTAFAKDGVASMPLWNSESGSFWHNGADSANAMQDRQSALDITMRGVECLACGATRYFPFVLPYYEEGPNNWGMMDRNGTPQRSMAAYVRSIELLANRAYIGDWRIGNAPLTRARAFADDKTVVVVLYAEKIDPHAAVAIPLPKTGVEILGVDGRKLALTANGRVPIPDGLTYLRITGPVTEFVDTLTEAAELYRVGHQPPPQRPEASPVVLQFRPDVTDYYDADPTGYRIRGDAPEILPITINVTNLSDQKHQASVSIDCEGVRLPEQVVELPPRTMVPLTWQVKIDMARRQGLANTDLKVLATSTTASRVDPMLIRFRGKPTVASILSQFKTKRKLSLLELNQWSPNAASGAVTTISVPEFETWQLAMNFNDVKDRWSFPQFNLPADINLSRYKGIVFEGLCRENAPAVRIAMWVPQPDGSTATYMTGNLFNSDNQWYAVYVPINSLTPLGRDNAKLDPSRIRLISFGVNSGTAVNELRIRNVWLVAD